MNRLSIWEESLNSIHQMSYAIEKLQINLEFTSARKTEPIHNGRMIVEGKPKHFNIKIKIWNEPK
jgi:hypothetical protein